MSSDSTIGATSEVPELIQSLPSACQDFARSLGGDHGVTTALMVAAVAQAARKRHSFQLGPHAPVVRPNLYVMLFAPPGHGKSRGVHHVFAPNYELEAESASRQQRRSMEFEAAITRRKWRIADLEEVAKKEKDDKELRRRVSKLQSRIRAEIERFDRCARWSGKSIATDVTPAGIRNELWKAPDGNASLILADGRHLVEQLLGSKASLGSSGLLTPLLNAFSGDTLRFVRASGPREIEIRDPRLSVMAAVQSDLGTRLLSSKGYADSGLASRFLVFFFDVLDAPHGDADPELAQAWSRLIKGIASPSGKKEQAVSWDVDGGAKERLRTCFSMFDGLASEVHASPLREAFWSRAGEQLQRLSLVRALMEKQTGPRPTITEESVYGAQVFLAHAWNHLEKGIALGCRPTVPHEDVERLRQAIHDAGGSLPLNPRKRERDAFGLSKSHVEKIVSLCPRVFAIGEKSRGGRRGRPLKVVELVS